MERSGAVGIGTLGKKPYQSSEHRTPNSLTVGTRTVATPVVAETGGDRESVAMEIISIVVPKGVPRRTHGGIRLISVLEPQPEHVGFFKVVSTKVQLSPLSPQFP